MFDNLKSYVLARLREPETYRGAAVLAAAVGVAVQPDQLAAIAAIGAALAGAVDVFSRSRPSS